MINTRAKQSEQRYADDITVRWQGFRSLADTGEITLPALTIIVGPNNVGKTSLFSPLLLMKQTLAARETNRALVTKGPLINAGRFADFVHQHDIERCIKFSIGFTPIRNFAKQIPKPGDLPPAKAGFEFTNRVKQPGLTLKTLTVQDVAGREILTRTLQNSGTYALGGEAFSSSRPIGKELLKIGPEGFLFSSAELIRAVTDSSRISKTNSKTTSRTTITIEGLIALYVAITRRIEERVGRLLNGLSYIGPLREQPRRFYELSGRTPTAVGVRGERAPELIFLKREDESFTAALDEWIRKFDFGGQLVTQRHSNEAFSLLIRRGRHKANITDTGFGLSQVLPVIVQSIRATHHNSIICEQPEIHLNPRLQGTLGDLFVAAANSGKRLIIETHSEHMIMRIRRLIAEGAIDAGRVALLFVEGANGISSVRRVPIDNVGHIEQASWPKGFFQDALREAMALSSAQTQAARTKNA